MKVRDIISCLSDNVFVKIIQEDTEKLFIPLIITVPDELMEIKRLVRLTYMCFKNKQSQGGTNEKVSPL